MHLIRYMINQIISITRKLAELYEDIDNARKDEINAAFSRQTFHDMLKEIRYYHRRFPSSQVFDETDHEYKHEVPDVKLVGRKLMDVIWICMHCIMSTLILELPLPAAPAADSAANVLPEWNAIYDAYNETCKQEECKPVATYALHLKGYVDQLESLGYMLPQDLIQM
nr:splicing factor SF3a60 homolog [Tanacetum cinerariifolium]